MNNNTIFIFLIVLLLGGVLFFRVFTKHVAPESGYPRAVVTIGKDKYEVEIADTILRRTQGLSGREGLREGTGMLFPFGSLGVYGFWMKDMKFAIDIVWIAEGRVVGFSENVPPPTGLPLTIYNPPQPVDTVLELTAGTVQGDGLTVGAAFSISSSE